MTRLCNDPVNIATPLSRIVAFALVLLCCASAQEPTWYAGKGSALGTDMEIVRSNALNAARSDALAKVGIEVRSSDTRLTSETAGAFVDFYSRFAESSSKGIILEERIVREGEPRRVQGTTFEIEIRIEARIAMSVGEADPMFTVTLEASRTIVKQGEPVTLRVTSTRDGFLTLFDVYRDSLSVLFPNTVDRENRIKADNTFLFPSGDSYDLQFAPSPGTERSEEILIAVVTKENVPFPPMETVLVSHGAIALRMEQLRTFAQWLHRIPLQLRSSSQVLVTVVK